MKSRFFPWRVFWQLVAIQLVGFLVIQSALFLQEKSGWSYEYRFVLAFFLSTVVAIIVSYRFSIPLKRVLLKTMRVASRNGIPSESEEADFFVDQPGEYIDLERALDQIQQHIKKRRTQVAHGREEARTLMRFLADGVVSLDIEERIQFFNSSFATQFLRPEQVLKLDQGKAVSLAEVFRDPELLSGFRSAISGGVVQSLQLKVPTLLEANGRSFSIRISPLHEEKYTQVYGVMAILHDVTEVVRAGQIRAEFVENASHELRTPLTSIKGFVTTAREDLAAGKIDEVPRFLKTVSVGVDRLITLVNDMLTLSSLENSGTDSFEQLSVAAVTEEAIENLQSLLQAKKVQIHTLYDCSDFYGHARHVVTVLHNLIENAIKYGPEGQRIDIVWSFDPEHKSVNVLVKDQGAGIDNQHLSRLFERFYRVDRGRSREVGGTGLGLAIVKHVMHLHAGSVHVNSSPGHGSEFICRFPDKTM